jgi:hypothetical protein
VAQSGLILVLTQAKAFYLGDHRRYLPTILTMATLAKGVPSLYFTVGAAQPGTGISVAAAPNGQLLVLAAASTGGRCWYAADNESTSSGPTGLSIPTPPPGDSYGFAPATGPAGCSASALGPTTLSGGWQPHFPSEG